MVMGTKMGPSYATLFVGYIEHQFFNQCNGPKPERYHRYRHYFFYQRGTQINLFYPAFKYTWEISDIFLAFLDINVSIERATVYAPVRVHYKPTDSHSYLLYSSSHPSHAKNSIPYSQFLRLRRLLK